MADETEQSEEGRDVTVVAPPAVVHARTIWSVKVSVTLPVEWMVAGFVGAVERFKAVAADPASIGNARDVCIAAQEAAQWLDSLDENFALGGDTHVQALRLVRDRTHHQWAAAIYQHPETGEWLWYKRSTLPLANPRFPTSKKRERLYDQVLAERPVRETLEHLRRNVAKLT